MELFWRVRLPGDIVIARDESEYLRLQGVAQTSELQAGFRLLVSDLVSQDIASNQ